jgi:hypothetical protein
MAFREFPKNNSETIRVTPRIFEGYELIDIRVFARNFKTGEVGPTKKGVSINVEKVPELLDALVWALGQACESDSETPETRLDPAEADNLAVAAWRALSAHGSAVHWDSAEKIVLSSIRGFSKWDLHYVLATRTDLFERVDGACYRARKVPGRLPNRQG